MKNLLFLKHLSLLLLIVISLFACTKEEDDDDDNNEPAQTQTGEIKVSISVDLRSTHFLDGPVEIELSRDGEIFTTQFLDGAAGTISLGNYDYGAYYIVVRGNIVRINSNGDIVSYRGIYESSNLNLDSPTKTVTFNNI